MLKTGLNCNYFSKAMERGLISRESRDSLAKMPGRRGTRGSDPLDLDPAGQI